MQPIERGVRSEMWLCRWNTNSHSERIYHLKWIWKTLRIRFPMRWPKNVHSFIHFSPLKPTSKGKHRETNVIPVARVLHIQTTWHYNTSIGCILQAVKTLYGGGGGRSRMEGDGGRVKSWWLVCRPRGLGKDERRDDSGILMQRPVGNRVASLAPVKALYMSTDCLVWSVERSPVNRNGRPGEIVG